MRQAAVKRRHLAEQPSARITPALRAFAGLPNVTIEDAALVAHALNWADAGADFADALHLASAAGCDGLAAFDKRLVRFAARLGGV